MWNFTVEDATLNISFYSKFYGNCRLRVGLFVQGYLCGSMPLKNDKKMTKEK